VNLKDILLPVQGRPSVSNDVSRDGRNDSKDERCDAKDANHCEEKTVVVKRERRESWMSSEGCCEGSGKRRDDGGRKRLREGKKREGGL
jgi:hypothetical protein